MTQERQRQSDTAPTTLALASVGSLAATFALGRLGLAGTLTGAALAPVLIALAREATRRSARRAARATELVKTRSGSVRLQSPAGRTRLRRLAGALRWRRVLAVGAGGFLLAATVVTLTDLALGESVASDRGRTLLPGGGEPRAPEPEERPAPAPTAEEEPTTAETPTEEEPPATSEPAATVTEPAPTDVSPPEPPAP